jgi:hypothetical protein
MPPGKLEKFSETGSLIWSACTWIAKQVSPPASTWIAGATRNAIDPDGMVVLSPATTGSTAITAAITK